MEGRGWRGKDGKRGGRIGNYEEGQGITKDRERQERRGNRGKEREGGRRIEKEGEGEKGGGGGSGSRGGGGAVSKLIKNPRQGQ